VKFPSEILVIYIVVSSFIHELLALTLFLLLMMFSGDMPGFNIIYLPFVFLFQLIFTLGLSLFLSALNVYIKDVSHIMGAVIMVLFFGTPIVYPLQAVPEKLRNLMGLNPVAQLVEIYRDLLLRNQLHSAKGVLYFVLLPCFFHRRVLVF
jgi:ABC-type polysaccharide/polyol phosphate export permease